MQKQLRRIITIFLLALFGLISSLTIQLFSPQRVIGVKPQTGELSCSATLSPEDLSVQGKANYEIGRFDEAINCWQKSVAAYQQQKNEAEAINNQINLAQAAFAMGLNPRSCNILLPIYGDKDCTLLMQDQEKRKQYSKKLENQEGLRKLLNTPTKIAGFRILANVFRGLGELDWSYEILVFLAKNNNSLPEQAGAILLDLGNTFRTLSNREQDYYNRTEQQDNFNCALTYASVADSVYQQALGYINQASDSPALMRIQTQLNQLTLVGNLSDWRDKIKKKMKDGSANIKCDDWNDKKNKPHLLDSDEFQFTDGNIYKRVSQLVIQYAEVSSQQIDDLQKQIEQLPESHAALFIRLNFAKTLISLKRFSKIEKFLKETIKQASDIGDLKVESYGYGYLGELHETRKKWKLAKDNTQQALFIAQSLSTGASPSDIEYLWAWQLGRIYKSQLSPRGQAQTKGIQQEGLKNLDDARQMYQQAYLTLQSLRRELVAGNPDAELSFQNDIEGIYRDYVNLLLWDSNPDQENLSKAREVIASLQAVELENFLRLACPESNTEEIDKIIDKQPVKTAFFYPILVEDRIEVIIKLRDDQNLKHYSTQVDEATVKKQIRDLQIDVKKYTADCIDEKRCTFNAVLKKLQLDLEEEYTFEDVKKEGKLVYDWLLKGAEQYLKGIDTLVFALDTNLRNIPLAALVVDDKEKTPKYLIDNYALALAPRLDIPKPKTLQGKGLKILAAGLKEQDDNIKLDKIKLKYPKLNYVEEEINAIKKIPNSNFSLSKLIDKDFKIKDLKKEIDTSAFKVLHLATHGEFSSSPEKTFLLASDGSIYINQIGDIFRKQAQKQPEPIEILVLSACETAAGDKRATLGISGVGVRAGARSSIASLWTLDDEMSVDFTKIFYRQLIQPKVTKAQALQQTQKGLKDLPGREHPRYWAPYILLGNWL